MLADLLLDLLVPHVTLCTHVSSGEDVGQQDEGCLWHVVRLCEQHGVGEAKAAVLGLTTAVDGALLATGSLALLAVEAVT